MASVDIPFSSAHPSITGPAPTNSRPSHRQDFQIAIICALSLEYDAAILLVDEFWDQDINRPYGRTSGDTNIYWNGRIGTHNVVPMLLPNMGKAAVAGSAASLRISYPSLKLVFLVGVCGGVPILGTHEALLGDVVISEAIVQYDFGRRYPDEFIPKETNGVTISAPNKDIRSLLAYFKSDTGKDNLRWNTTIYLKALQDTAIKKHYQRDYRYPGFSEDKPFKAMYHHKHRENPSCDICCGEIGGLCDEAAQASCAELGCDENELVLRQRLDRKRYLRWEEAQCPEIFIGRVASADTVMKSGDHRDLIAKRDGIIAFEMEGAGLRDEAPCIVIKGICDYADSHKNKIWQPFAAATAAAAVKAMLGRYTLTDHLEPSTRITPFGQRNLLWDAISDFQSALTDDQRHELRNIRAIPDTDAVLIFTAQLDSLNRNRKGRSVASRLHSVLQSVRDFSVILETFVSTHAGIAPLLWGSVKLTMLMAVKFVSYYEALSKLLMDLGEFCPRWTEYQTLYLSSTQLQKTLCNFYASLVRCCRRVVETTQRPWSAYFFDSRWESFEREFNGSVIDRLLTEKHSSDVFISFFFVRFDDSQSLNAEFILRSIIRQALNQLSFSEEIEVSLENMQLSLSSGLKELLELLQKIVAAFKAFYIVIDAVDECEKQDRDDLLQGLSSLATIGSNTKLFLASRDSVSREIQKRFTTFGHLAMNCSSAQADIGTYVEGIVREKLQSEELIVEDSGLIEEIKMALTKGADGMLLWVAFQVDELCLQHCDDDIQKAIRNLPKGLEETFDRAVSRIVSQGNENIAKQVFRWVAAAKEPLSLNQLREVIFIEVGQQYSKVERRSNGIDYISSWCENLVHIDEELKTVQFAHQAVRQFLLEKYPEARNGQFYLEIEDADHYIGEICVTYLNFNDFKTTLARRPRPLPPIPSTAIAITALKHKWKVADSVSIFGKFNLKTRTGTAAADAVGALATFQRNDEREAKERLQAEHPFLRARIMQNAASNGDIILLDVVLEGEKQGHQMDQALQAAIRGGHLNIVERLLAARADINIPSKHSGRTTLQAATQGGHLDIIKRLLTAGADINAPSRQYSQTALQAAAKGGHLDIVERLLAAGADVNAPSGQYGRTALQAAAEDGHLAIIERLLAAKADINAPAEHSGRTALQAAAQGGHLDIVSRLEEAGNTHAWREPIGSRTPCP
ncbi:Putative ankyrin repeat protein [Cladobotryum mycophilum]|uniref:Ankyrin repeat protein n=1 Tax=Cladobotryum mycophilum TaxID=491253 RepID=A0ABR0S9E7_9HYPO